MSKNEEIIIEELDSQEFKGDYKLKIVVIGDSRVGKTNLIKRFITNTFNQNSKSTLGVEFMSKLYKIKNHIFKIEIWDTAGQERYKSITSVYYKGAKGALVVYDITSKISFNNLDKWMTEIKDITSKDIRLMIIGNKIDLKQFREVTIEEAVVKAKEFGIPLIETSALDATNVNKAFNVLLTEIYNQTNIPNTLNVPNISNNNDLYNYKYGIDLNTDRKKKYKCSWFKLL